MLEQSLRWLGFGLCHQLPERSFFGGGVQVPVCARDTGIYVGFVVGMIALWLIHRTERPSELAPPFTMALLVGFVGVMAIDGVTSYAGLRSTTNGLRLLTGLMTGLALSAFVVPLLNGQLWRRYGSGRVLARPIQLLAFLSAVPISYLLVMWFMPLLGIAFPVLVALAILVTFLSVNMVVVCLMPAFERRAEALSELWRPAVVALIVTLAELAAASLIRLWLLRSLGMA